MAANALAAKCGYSKGMAHWTLVEGRLSDGLPMRLYIAEWGGKLCSASLHDLHPKAEDEFTYRLRGPEKWIRYKAGSGSEALASAARQIAGICLTALDLSASARSARNTVSGSSLGATNENSVCCDAKIRRHRRRDRPSGGLSCGWQDHEAAVAARPLSASRLLDVPTKLGAHC
jgi:hypothetical protein